MIFTLDIAAMPAGYGEALLPLAAAKAHLRVLHDDEDDLIDALRDAAVTMVEQFTGLVLAPRTGADAMVWRAEALPVTTAPIRLGVRPIRSIVSMSYLDSAGDEQAVDVADLRIVDGDSIMPKPGARWPVGVAGGVTVTFAVGLDGGKVPASLIHAAKMFVATLYDQRELAVSDGLEGEITAGFAMMCRPYRRYRV